MSKKPDVLVLLPQEQRNALLRDTCIAVFGDRKGAQIWKRLAPTITFKGRQVGDAIDPKDNFWNGVWRIYEAE